MTNDSRRSACRLGVLVFLAAAGLSAAVSEAHDQTKDQARTRSAAVQAQADTEADHALTALGEDQVCRLTLELIDQGTVKPGLIRVTDPASGKPVALNDGLHRARNWYVVPGPAVVRLPRRRLRIEAFHGIETELGSAELDLTGQETAVVRLPLKRFTDLRSRGLWSGNTHLHLMKLSRPEAERYLRDVPAADGLDLVFLSYLQRAEADKEYISNTFRPEDLDRLSRSGTVLFENGEEHRHNFGAQGEGYGHVMFLRLESLILPVSLGPGIMKTGTDGQPLQRGIVQARRQGATVIWCHNTFGLEDLPNWLAGLLDAQNIFDGGQHGHYADTFYRYLDLGLTVPFSTGTDWGIYDFSRVYVPIDGELTSRRWLDALGSGRSMITNGPLLEFTVAGRAAGETLALDGPKRLAVTGQAVGRGDFRAIELIHNGKVVERVEAAREEGHYAAKLAVELAVDEPGWLALRVPPESGKNELDQTLFAHTSAVTVEMGGQRRFVRSEGARLRSELERSVESIGKQAVFADPDEREAVLRVYREALRQLDGWIERGSSRQAGRRPVGRSLLGGGIGER